MPCRRVGGRAGKRDGKRLGVSFVLIEEGRIKTEGTLSNTCRGHVEQCDLYITNLSELYSQMMQGWGQYKGQH